MKSEDIPDIVERLWVCPQFITSDRFGYPVTMPNEMTKRNKEERIEAAREITRLRTEALGNKRRIQDQDAIMAELWERINSLTSERDEARLLYCNQLSPIDPHKVAEKWKWDCFNSENEKFWDALDRVRKNPSQQAMDELARLDMECGL